MSGILCFVLGAAPVPLFEMVYRDCIAAHGKYGYDVMQSAGYVLRHIGLGRPLPLRPAVAEFMDEGARQAHASEVDGRLLWSTAVLAV